MECSEAIEGVHEDHCLHDLRRRDTSTRGILAAGGYGQICCWCGDLFHSRQETNQHGEYEPGISRFVKFNREAASRKEAALKLREHRHDVRIYKRGHLSDEQVKGLERLIALGPKQKQKQKRSYGYLYVCPECGKPKSKPVVCRECKR